MTLSFRSVRCLFVNLKMQAHISQSKITVKAEVYVLKSEQGGCIC